MIWLKIWLCINFDDVHTNYYRLFDVIYIYSHNQCDIHTIYIQVATVFNPRTRKYSAVSPNSTSRNKFTLNQYPQAYMGTPGAPLSRNMSHIINLIQCITNLNHASHLHVYIICICKAYIDCRRCPMLNPSIRSETTAGGVWCLGLLYGPKTDRDGVYN